MGPLGIETHTFYISSMAVLICLIIILILLLAENEMQEIMSLSVS